MVWRRPRRNGAWRNVPECKPRGRVLIFSELPELKGITLYWSFVEFERDLANQTRLSGIEAP